MKAKEARPNPEPDHPGGYTLKYLSDYLTEHEYDAFMDWMAGQTIGIDNGEPIYYPQDFEYWLGGGRYVFD